jgi:hypothetical protein
MIEVIVYKRVVERETHGLQLLLVLAAEGTALEGNDRGRGVGVVGNGRAALGAEDAVDVLARGALAGVALGVAGDGELVLGDYDDEGCCAKKDLC